MQTIEERAAATDVAIVEGITIEVPSGLSPEEKAKMAADEAARLANDPEFLARRDRHNAARVQFDRQREANERALLERLKAKYEAAPTEGFNPAVD